MAHVSRQVHLVEYPDGEITPSYFQVAELELPALARR